MRNYEKKEYISCCGNTIYTYKDFIISYNPCVRESIIELFPDSAGREETALTIDDKYAILNGDFREEYDKCINLSEAIKVYRENIQFKSEWSTYKLHDSEENNKDNWKFCPCCGKKLS